tara:strand:+ start:329 stop:592 length:264 start_codon:yes stop_codon:yes gene_type:complete
MEALEVVEELNVMLVDQEMYHPLVHHKAMMVVVLLLEIIQLLEVVRLLLELMVVVLSLQGGQAQQLQLMHLQQRLQVEVEEAQIVVV